MAEHTVCNLCGHDDADPYRQGRDWQLGGSEVWDLVRCRGCGLIYLDPRPEPGAMDRYYPPDYEPFVRSPGGRGSRFARWSYARYLDRRCRQITRHRAPGRLLDVGCASGDFLARLRRWGWLVQGVEPNAAAAQAAHRVHGLDVFPGELRQACLPAALFDAVTLWDVLEHMHDPSAELAEIHRLLKSGGLLVVELPNPHSFDAALFGRYWIGLDMPRHLHVFPPRPLAYMLQKCGFRILLRRCSSGGYGAFVRSLQSWSSDQSQMWLRRLGGSLAASPALRFLLLPYNYLAYGLRRGPEITLVCEKVGD
jgi:SAM-dependent methyltransferase